MKHNSIALQNNTTSQQHGRWIDNVARNIFHKKFSSISDGSVTLFENDELFRFGTISSDKNKLNADIYVEHPSFYSDVIFGGTVGAGESYMAGNWSSDNLTALIRIILQNENVLNDIEAGAGKFMTPIHKLFHLWHRNTLEGSRKNISAHYDLGNDLFSLFLDPTMMYSCAAFENETMTLEQASIAKLDRICRKLDLNEKDHVLEIGTGWGGFAIHAASRYGCRVTSTTISKEQYTYAVKQVKSLGLEHKITLLCEDYRNLAAQTTTKFDKLVSIEMIEAVGHQYYKQYFQTCSDLLKPEGMMLLQSITMADQRYHQAIKEVDFIQRYIFPGGCLPSVSVISSMISKHTDMRFFHLDDIGEDYAKTLEIWRERFFANIDKVRELGYNETFIRMWDFYLCYCEGGFKERGIGTIQLLLTKPACRRDSVLSV